MGEITLEVSSFCGEQIVDGEILVRQLPPQKLAWMLERMCETRYFEETAEELYTLGLVHGTMHLSIGMEASPIGIIAAL